MSNTILLYYTQTAMVKIQNENYYIYTFAALDRDINIMFLSKTEPSQIESANFDKTTITQYNLPFSIPNSEYSIYFSGDLEENNYLINSSTNTSTLINFSSQEITTENNYFLGDDFNYSVFLYKSENSVTSKFFNDAYVYLKVYNTYEYPGKVSVFIYIAQSTSELYNDKTFEFSALNDVTNFTDIGGGIKVVWDKTLPIYNPETQTYNPVFYLESGTTKTEISYHSNSVTKDIEFVPNFGRYFSFVLDQENFVLYKFEAPTRTNQFVYVLFINPCNSKIDSVTQQYIFNATLYTGNKNITSITDLDYYADISVGENKINDLFLDQNVVFIWDSEDVPDGSLMIYSGQQGYVEAQKIDVTDDLETITCTNLFNNGFRRDSTIDTVYNFQIEGLEVSMNGVTYSLFLRVLRYASNADIATLLLYAYNNSDVLFVTALAKNNDASSYSSASQSIQFDNNIVKFVWDATNLVSPASYGVTSDSGTSQVSVWSSPPDGISGSQIDSFLLPSLGIFQTASFYWLMQSSTTITINNVDYFVVVFIFNNPTNLMLLHAYAFLTTESSPNFGSLDSSNSQKLCPGLNSLTLMGTSIGKLTWNAVFKNFLNGLNLVQADGTVVSFTNLEGNQIAERQNIINPLDSTFIPSLPDFNLSPCYTNIVYNIQGSDRSNIVYYSELGGEASENNIIQGYFFYLFQYIEKNEVTKPSCVFFDSNTKISFKLCEGKKYNISLALVNSTNPMNVQVIWNGKISNNFAEVIKITSNSGTIEFKNFDSRIFASSSDLIKFLNQNGLNKNSYLDACSTNSNITTFDSNICSQCSSGSTQSIIYISVIVGLIILLLIALAILFFKSRAS